MCRCRSEDNLWSWFLTFHSVEFRDETQVIRLDSKPLCPLTHITSPCSIGSFLFFPVLPYSKGSLYTKEVFLNISSLYYMIFRIYVYHKEGIGMFSSSVLPTSCPFKEWKCLNEEGKVALVTELVYFFNRVIYDCTTSCVSSLCLFWGLLEVCVFHPSWY